MTNSQNENIATIIEYCTRFAYIQYQKLHGGKLGHTQLTSVCMYMVVFLHLLGALGPHVYML